MPKPVAVVLSDVHYDLSTLELADAATRMAINKANELKVPLIVAGDLHNTKANMRAECVNRMLETFSLSTTCVMILRGNHDQVNERSQEHSLNFLSRLSKVCIVDSPLRGELNMLPYYHDPDELRVYLKTLPKGATLVMHQGLKSSNAGDYIQDKSAITKDDVAGFQVLSGHYHQRQTIPLPDGGVWNYIGNPYSLNFGEANDPEKGYQILMDDGSLEFVPTNLRKHVIIELEGYNLDLISGPAIQDIKPDDLVWVKVIGTKEQLSRHSKDKIAKALGLQTFKLDFTPVNHQAAASLNPHRAQPEILDSIIDLATATPECKVRLKQLWKDMA